MRTDDIAFEQQMAALTARIAECPPEQREALEQLAEETRQRHQSNRTNIRAAREGLDRLDVLRDLNELQLAGLDAQISGLAETLEQVHTD